MPPSLADSDTLVSVSDYGAEKQMSDDLYHCKPRWWALKWSMLFISPAVTIVAVIVPTALCLHESIHNQGPFGCDPAGKVWVAGSESNHKLSLWDVDYVLSPSIILWKTSFRTAKAVDVCWDLIVGRGFSALVALLVYGIFRVVLADARKNEPLPQDQLLAMEYSTTSVPSLWRYVKGCARRMWRSGRNSCAWSCAATFQLILLVIYVLICPTWLSAMTSYQATTSPVLKVGSDYTSLETLISCRFHITDGRRVGLPDEVCVPTSGALHDAVEKYIQSKPVVGCYGKIVKFNNNPWENGLHFYNPASFNTAAPPRRECNRSSIFELDGQPIHLASPVLHLGGIQYAHNGQPIDATSLQSRSIYQSSQVGQYEWGVSFLLLFWFMIVTFLLMLSLLLTWFKFYDRMLPQQIDMVFGNVRTALVVATSVRDALGDKVDVLSDVNINERLLGSDGGVRQSHVRSDIMSLPGLFADQAKDRSRFVVGSEAYKRYIAKGYDSIKRRT